MIDFTSPNALALANLLGLGFLGALAAFGQWYGKRKETAPPTSKDVVVQSLTVADTAAITGMADTLRESNRVARSHRKHDTEILYELRAIKESHQRIEIALGRMLDHMPDKEDGGRVLALLGRMFDHMKARGD